MECPNCQARVSKDWAHCPKCGADIESGTFSSTDDPIDKLSKRVNKIDEYLTGKFPEDLEGDPNEPQTPPATPPEPRRKQAAKKRRKTLFGE